MCLTEQEAREYKEYLENLAATKSDQMFSNGGKDHAVVLYSVLLNHANLSARFFCECAESEIWQNKIFRTALVNALRKADFQVKILVRQNNKPDFEWLPKELKERVKVKIITEENLNKINNHFCTDSCNFSVFDHDMFRFEYDVVGYKAYGSFNGPDAGESMAKLFDECFNVNVA